MVDIPLKRRTLKSPFLFSHLDSNAFLLHCFNDFFFVDVVIAFINGVLFHRLTNGNSNAGATNWVTTLSIRSVMMGFIWTVVLIWDIGWERGERWRGGRGRWSQRRRITAREERNRFPYFWGLSCIIILPFQWLQRVLQCKSNTGHGISKKGQIGQKVRRECSQLVIDKDRLSWWSLLSWLLWFWCSPFWRDPGIVVTFWWVEDFWARTYITLRYE